MTFELEGTRICEPYKNYMYGLLYDMKQTLAHALDKVEVNALAPV